MSTASKVSSAGRRRNVAGMALTILTLHVMGWGTLLFLVVPAHYQFDGGAFGVGLGATAYALGMRHAFDAFPLHLSRVASGRAMHVAGVVA
ncbi:hypothetical protein [Rhodococcus sp. NPDC127528]|uniref:hypothetical protein n=1 Tax=unclassified Rhodococcus (in: high G+C Gram-positive bacteria) TaxID=192944 RepID=UPI0036455E0D